MGYRKRLDGRSRWLVYTSGYHVQGELVAALRRRGHPVWTLPVGQATGGHRTVDAALRALIDGLLRFRPDVVLSINHIGLDHDGQTGQLLGALGVPLAIWYVDCPRLVHDGLFLPAAATTSLFVWERAALEPLRCLGARQVAWLPLATCPEAMAPRPAPAASVPRRCALFVGNSMAAPQQAWQDKCAQQPQGQADGLSFRAQLECGGRQRFAQLVAQARPRPDPAMTQLAWATYAATGQARRRSLSRLAAAVPLQVVGDAGWPAALQPKPAVPYGPQLADLYRSHLVTVNLTSLQMPTALNQRCFDVPAAGGLLLSDAQEDLRLLFPADAIATFADDEELHSRAAFLLRRPLLAQQQRRRAQAHVMAHHTYEHRIARMLRLLGRAWS